MEEDFFDPDFLLPYIRPDRLSPDAFQRISELSKLKIPRHFLKKYFKTHFRATISKAQLKNFKDGLYQIPTSPPAESPTTSDMGDVVNVEEWSSANSPNDEPQTGPMETQDIGQTEVRTSVCTQCIKNITDEALVDALDKANGEQLTRLAVPRLGSRLSLWQLLTLHCKVGETPDAVITLLLEEFVNFVKYVQDFLRRQLDRSELESPTFSAHEGLWGQQKTVPSYFDSSRMQKSPWRPRSFHRPVQDEGSLRSASQKNFFVPVTGGLVQIETADQAAILGLPRGRYRMRLPPDFVKPPATLPSPRPPPAKLSRADFYSSTTASRQPASFLPASNAGCFSSPSPSVEVNRPTARATPLPPAPLSSTQPMTFENDPPASGSFAPTALPVADQLLTPAQSTPQVDAESPATTRSSTVLKHRFYLLPGHKKPLELPLTETGKTVSSTTPDDPPSVPPDESSPEPAEPPPKSVVTSNPKTPPPPTSSKSRSKPCPVISEPPAADPPTSKPLSRPTPQLRILDRDSGEPIPNEWISSGGLQPLVLDPGSPSTSLLEPASGGISHPTTGSLVSCAPPSSFPLPPPPPLSTLTSTTPTLNASSTDASTTNATISSVFSTSPPPLPVGGSPVTNGSAATAQTNSSPQPPQKRLCTRDFPPPSSYSPPPIISLPRPPAKLDTLDEPVLEIERISDSRVVVTRADGARFMVEDGGDGLTQATIETILQLNG